MPIREFDLIDRYFSELTPVNTNVACGIGDDAAVLDVPDHQDLLVSVDTLVNGVHFFSNTTSYDVGYKSLAVNISDIAAMGGLPRWATLALTLPEIEEDWLAGFANGFADIALKYGISLIGGDTTRGPLSITVQIMGTVDTGQGLLRSGAKPGDLIYVSGYLGTAGLAYKALAKNPVDDSIPAHCLERLHRPEPRVDLGQHLRNLATALIDVSDGLAADLNHLLSSSGVAAEVQLEKLPVCKELESLADVNTIWQIALAAGDDYELCFTIAADQKMELEKRTKNLSYPVTCIGEITSGEGISWIEENGQALTLKLDAYEHF
ncbi:MAG: thiamine-monophosphate kinase [Gammaproteobacteria bacterium]|jgi:thiamine-monophosphate kinase